MGNYYKKASDWMLEGKKSISISAFTPVAPAITGSLYELSSSQAEFSIDRPFRMVFLALGFTAGVDIIGEKASRYLSNNSQLSSQIRSSIERRVSIASQAIENSLANGTSLPSSTNKRLNCRSVFSGYELHLTGAAAMSSVVAGTQIEYLSAFNLQRTLFEYPTGLQVDTQITQTVLSANVMVGVLYALLPNSSSDIYRRRYAQAYVNLLLQIASNSNDFLSEAFQNGTIDAQRDINQIGLTALRLHIIRYYMISRDERGVSNDSDRHIVTSADERLLLNNHQYQQELVNRIVTNLLIRPNQLVREGWADDDLPASLRLLRQPQ